MLPDALDPEALRTIAIAVLVALAVVAFLVMRFIQKMVLRVILLGALVGVGVGVWVQRDDLKECVPQCACQFFGQEVSPDQIPGCRDEDQDPSG